MTPPIKGLGFAVLCGLGVSIAVGTLLLVLAPYLGIPWYEVPWAEVGAFLGGITAGLILFTPVRRGGIAGGLAGLLSFAAYFIILPILYETGLLQLTDLPDIPPDAFLVTLSLIISIVIIAGAGAAGGLLSAYLKNRIAPPMAGRATCSYCQAALPSEAVYCPNCGRNVR